MNDQYKTPESRLNDVSEITIGDPATRWNRLTASIIDGVVISIITIPLLMLVLGFDKTMLDSGANYKMTILMNVVSLLVFFAINGRYLARDGQSIGKKALGIRVVSADGTPASFQQNIAPRYLFFFLIGILPVAGQLVSILNVLLIFRRDRRCLPSA